MATAHARARLGSRGRPEESRTAILQAAIREFAREGVAGARTDAIARAAKVNKALLYYYFHDKDALYGAALDHVFQERNKYLMPVLAENVPPAEKILRFVGAFFDFLAEHPSHREMVQRELFNVPGRAHMQRIVKLYMRPMFEEMTKVVREGIVTGIFPSLTSSPLINNRVLPEAPLPFFTSGLPFGSNSNRTSTLPSGTSMSEEIRNSCDPT